MIRDRLSWLGFLGFDLGAPTPDANTIRLFCERLTEAKAITVLFGAFDNRLRTNGYLAMGGQIVDATLVVAPKQRNTQEAKEAIKAGRTAAEVWPDKPAKAAQKDVMHAGPSSLPRPALLRMAKEISGRRSTSQSPALVTKITSPLIGVLASSARAWLRTVRATMDRNSESGDDEQHRVRCLG